MAEETPRLTLGFIGEQEVHRASSLALLKDLVGAWLKQHRKAEVLILLQARATDTLDDIYDWAQTSGYGTDTYAPGDMVSALLVEDDARLILVGDPNEDDTVYAVAEEAARHKIQTRSLINGLEKVVFDDDEDADLAEGFHEVDLDDEDAGIDFPEDDDLDDDLSGLAAQPDLDVLADLADGGETEAQEEIKQIAETMGINVEPFETWVEAVAAIRGNGLVKEEELDPTPEVPSPVAEVVEPTTSEEAASADAEDPGPDEESEDILPEKKWTRAELEAKDFPAVKAIAVEHGIAPGRGMKHGVLVNKILQVSGVETEPPAKKKATKAVKTAPPMQEATITPIRAKDESNPLVNAVAVLREVADSLETLV